MCNICSILVYCVCYVGRLKGTILTSYLRDSELGAISCAVHKYGRQANGGVRERQNLTSESQRSDVSIIGACSFSTRETGSVGAN